MDLCRTAPLTIVLAIVAFAALTPDTRAEDPPLRTVIDDYVHAADPSYRWRIVSEEPAGAGTSLVVEFVSQRWLTAEDVDRTEWRHWLTVAVPEKVTSDVGLLFIGGGRNGRGAPDGPSGDMRTVAAATNTVAAELRMVPNQPLVFHDDGVERFEDDLIGYAWRQYLETGEARWLPRNAMVKSAVRAMDTITAVLAAREAPIEVDRFVVAGGSKRGWTTWLTGAVDPRVIAIAPIVIDVLNADISMRHHFAAYGFWAPSIGNYVDHGIMERMDEPRLAELYRLVDPYHYRHRLTMPKYIINASGDQFFLPDSSQFYLRDLRGETYLRYVPNADHGLDGSDALAGLVAFHGLMATGGKPPSIHWRWDDERLTVFTSGEPVEVKLWQATNPSARDFRIETFGPGFGSRTLDATGPGLYQTVIQPPAAGWKAAFAEAAFDVGGKVFKVSTSVRVTPDTVPFVDKSPTQPASITAVCTPASGSDAAALGKTLASELRRNGVGRRTRSVVKDTRLYLNWTPAGGLYARAQEVRQRLEDGGCTGFAWQLESGREITLPPVRVSR